MPSPKVASWLICHSSSVCSIACTFCSPCFSPNSFLRDFFILSLVTSLSISSFFLSWTSFDILLTFRFYSLVICTPILSHFRSLFFLITISLDTSHEGFPNQYATGKSFISFQQRSDFCLGSMLTAGPQTPSTQLSMKLILLFCSCSLSIHSGVEYGWCGMWCRSLHSLMVATVKDCGCTSFQYCAGFIFRSLTVPYPLDAPALLHLLPHLLDPYPSGFLVNKRHYRTYHPIHHE